MPFGANDLVDLGAIEDLPLEQPLGHEVEQVDVVLEQLLAGVVAILEESPYLGIEGLGGLVG